MYKEKKVVCISYGSGDYQNVAKLNLETALEHGADEVKQYGSKDLPWTFLLRNCIHFLRYPQCAYWVWKPYVILNTLKKMENGEYLVYSDAASIYIDDISKLLDVFDRDGLDIMPFSLNTLEREYSKGDAFFLLKANTPEIVNSKQRLATFVVMKKSSVSLDFVKKWLKACQNILIAWGSFNVFMKNYPEYIANRNDQTAYSILTKKMKLPAYRDPSQYGNNEEKIDKEIIQRSNYPEIWYSTRNPRLTEIEQVRNVMMKDKKYNQYYDNKM